MKRTRTISAAVAAGLGLAGNAQAVVLSFTNSTVAGVQGTDFNFTCNTSDFDAGREFRFCDPSGQLGGGNPLDKDTASGNEVWTFDNNSLAFISATGAAPTYGVNPAYTGYNPGTSADPDGGVAMDDGAVFLGNVFSFLAPVEGSDAASAYGAGSFAATSATTFELFFPVLEMQWGGVYFTPGEASGGITFHGTHDGTSFSMWAEELIQTAEDPHGVGLTDWSFQWYYVGAISDLAPVPLPAAAWLLGSGLVGLTAAARRRRKLV